MKCRVPGLGPCHNLWEEFNEGLKFWLKVETVDSDNRPVRIPLPLRDHKDTTARNCPDILVDINDKVDRGADIHDFLAPVLHEGIHSAGPGRRNFGIELLSLLVGSIGEGVTCEFYPE